MKKMILSAAFLAAFTGTASAAVSPDYAIEPMTEASDQFGWSIDQRGTHLLIGVPRDASAGNAAGAVHTYSSYADGNGGVRYEGEAVAYPPFSNAGTTSMGFGYSVSGDIRRAGDPDLLFVGAPFYDYDGKLDAGAVFVYHLDDGAWIYDQMITSPTGAEAHEKFGYSVASYDRRLVVGAPFKNSAGVYDSGAVHVYDINIGYQSVSASHDFSLTDPNGVEAGGQFGYSVDVTYSFYIVGAPGSDRSGTNSGNAIVFDERNPSADWHNIEHSSIDAYTGLGHSVAASGYHFAIGAPDADFGAFSNAGAVYVGKFDIRNSSLSNPQVWTAFDGNTPMAESNARFGFAVDIYASPLGDKFNVIAGAPQQDYEGFYGDYINAGAAYLMLDDGSQQQYKMAYSSIDLGDLRYMGRAVSMSAAHAFSAVPSNGLSSNVQKVLDYSVPDPR